MEGLRWARNTGKNKNKNRSRKTKKIKWNKRTEIRIELIKYTTKRDTEKLRINRTNKLKKLEEVKKVIKELTI